MQIFKNPDFDFVRYRWQAMALSLAVILAGAIAVAVRGMPIGIEFSGGTLVIVQFDQAPSDQQVRSALGRAIPGGGENSVVQRYGPPEQRQVMIRVREVGAESGSALSQTADTVVRALKEANLGNFTVVGTEIVGPIVGSELTRKGILATTFALAGILAYIAVRFQFSFAVGAVVATIHDVLITLSFLAFFRYDLSLNVIAAILTMTGYSVNDTIVIFDRVRERSRDMRRDTLDHVVNVAVNQTLGRTVLTAGTALMSILALFLFGGEVLHGFAFTLLVGVITGTYSTVYIAVAIVSFWPRRGPTRAPAAPPAPQPSGRSRSKARNSRAS
jgi:preprotein translocase subunit SecF